MTASLRGYLRQDGRKGVRNVIAVAYLVECAHHVARAPVTRSDDLDVHLIGFPGCYPNAYALKVMQALGTHPNIGGVLLMSLGCESFNREQLRATIEASGRPVETLVIQEAAARRPPSPRGWRPSPGSRRSPAARPSSRWTFPNW